jgi:hypothetical protein
MPADSTRSSQEAERDELNAVMEALAKTPRLSRLVRYLGQKYFAGEIDQLHEYDIATEVFGRSKTTFDAGEDAIARVEAHRLRKRLKAFYESDGKDHPVQLSVPSGTYVPVFTHRADKVQPSTDRTPAILKQGIEASAASEEQRTDQRRPGSGLFPLRLKGKGWLYTLMAAGVVVAALGGYLADHLGAAAKNSGSGTSAAQLPATSQPVSAESALLPIRIMAGYSGRPQIDSAGAVWGADRYFKSGGTWKMPPNFIARTSDPMLFGQWRTGDFFYDIPLQPGVYELHLYFVTIDRANDATPTFSIGINGNIVLPGFDVNSDAMGENIADERVFRDVSPAKDGYLHLAFTSERGAPALNAIEILRGTANKQLPIRLVMQPSSYTDHDGNFWHQDNYFMNGRLSTKRQQIMGSLDSDLFAGERYGHFSYAIPVDTRDRYTVVLHFAEFFFGSRTSGVGGTGSRVFRVMCNGVLLLDNFDIFKEAGSLHELTKTFYHLKPTAQGKLNLTFEPITNNATVSGIEVLDESK